MPNILNTTIVFQKVPLSFLSYIVQKFLCSLDFLEPKYMYYEALSSETFEFETFAVATG